MITGFSDVRERGKAAFDGRADSRHRHHVPELYIAYERPTYQSRRVVLTLYADAGECDC